MYSHKSLHQPRKTLTARACFICTSLPPITYGALTSKTALRASRLLIVHSLPSQIDPGGL
jgi:hypothetical protein